MNVQDYQRLGARLEELLRLRSHMVAIKWLEKEADIPADAIVPTRDLKKHMALCQAFTYARMKSKTIAMTKRDHWCWNPLIGYGQVECVPGQPQFDEVCTYIGIPDRQKAEAFFARFPRLPLGKYEAVLVAPLTKCGFEPDVITLYGTPFQINYLCRCIKSVNCDSFTSVFDGIDSCIYCTVPTFQDGVFRVTFPDPGEIERAHARDDEVILTIPPEKLQALCDAVEFLSSFMPCNDQMLEISLDFARPPFYNKLYALWGLDQGEDWALGGVGKLDETEE